MTKPFQFPCTEDLEEYEVIDRNSCLVIDRNSLIRDGNSLLRDLFPPLIYDGGDWRACPLVSEQLDLQTFKVKCPKGFHCKFTIASRLYTETLENFEMGQENADRVIRRLAKTPQAWERANSAHEKVIVEALENLQRLEVWQEETRYFKRVQNYLTEEEKNAGRAKLSKLANDRDYRQLTRVTRVTRDERKESQDRVKYYKKIEKENCSVPEPHDLLYCTYECYAEKLNKFTLFRSLAQYTGYLFGRSARFQERRGEFGVDKINL
uniref:Uncharacterized protein n=1 Tax=Lobelia heterophylla subsp. heterophylla TaxID=2041129 RepID=A0A291EYE1_9ASTR|nr:hypothetical protein Lo_he_he1Pt0601 [Lobelia heterophylla subsp. heterophylla]